MATTVNTHEAKTNLSKLLARVEAGEEIIIARAGKAVAKLVPVEESPRERRFGTAGGQIRMLDNWEWTDEELADFYNAPLTTTGDD